MKEYSLNNLPKGFISLDNIPRWQLLSFWVILTGYIGFFTYCAKQNMPYLQGELNYIVAFGLFNLVALFSMFYFTNRKKMTESYEILALYGILTLFTLSPLSIAIAAFFFVFSWEGLNGKVRSPKKGRFSEVRKKYFEIQVQISRRRLFGAIGVAIIGIIGTLLYDVYFFGTYLCLHLFLFTIHKIRATKKTSYLNVIFIFGVIFPIFITFTFLDRINFTFLGISNTHVEIFYKDGKEEEGILKFRDKNFIYLDNETFSSSRAISSSEIKKIHFLKKVVELKKRTGLDIVNKLIENYKQKN